MGEGEGGFRCLRQAFWGDRDSKERHEGSECEKGRRKPEGETPLEEEEDGKGKFNNEYRRQTPLNLVSLFHQPGFHHHSQGEILRHD